MSSETEGTSDVQHGGLRVHLGELVGGARQVLVELGSTLPHIDGVLAKQRFRGILELFAMGGDVTISSLRSEEADGPSQRTFDPETMIGDDEKARNIVERAVHSKGAVALLGLALVGSAAAGAAYIASKKSDVDK
jgi:hypothetical protein